MNQKIKSKFPKWCHNSKKGEYATVLTNDLDSLLGCMIEKQVNNNEINYYYNFNRLFVANSDDSRGLLGIDLALHKGRSFCNHVVKINADDYVNPDTANINVIKNIHQGNYTDKYAMSTALLMWSFYDLPLPKTKEGKMLLLAIDSGFLGHYSGRFNEVHTHYLELLGFTELNDLLNNTTKNDYIKLQKQYNTKSEITLNKEGYLQTKLPLDELEGLFGVSLELPEQQFKVQNKFKEKKGYTYNVNTKDKLEGNIISFALTRQNQYKYTYV